MEHLTFFDVHVDRAAPIGAAIARLRAAGFAVSGDYDDAHRPFVPEPEAPSAVRIAFARLGSELCLTGVHERWAHERGLRLATLREALALAASRPDDVAAAAAPVAVLGGKLRIDGDPEIWVPVFPSVAPRSLCVEPVGNFWGNVQFPVVQL